MYIERHAFIRKRLDYDLQLYHFKDIFSSVIVEFCTLYKHTIMYMMLFLLLGSVCDFTTEAN